MPSRYSRPLGNAPILVSTQANPIRLAWTLARQRRVRNLFASRGRAACSIAAFVLLSALIAVATWQQLRLHGAIFLSPVLAHPVVAAVIATTIGWIVTMRRRRSIEQQIAQSWLASTPLCVHDRRAALRWRVGVDVIAPIAVVLAALACAGLASGTSVASLLAAVVAGVAVGVLAGWHSGAKPSRDRVASLPRLRQTRAATSLAASLAPLGRWPFARLRAAANPRIETRLICALLLSLPMGIPPWVALLILTFAVNALAAFSLLRASLATIPAAADWLRATPLGFGPFARSTCLRTCACHAAFAMLSGILAHGLGASTRAAGLLAVAWFAVAMTATASALVCRHRPERLMSELAGIGALLLAIAVATPFALAPAWPALWLWQMTRMRNA